MKVQLIILAVVACVVANTHSADGLSEQQKRDIVRLMSKNCKEREHATDDDLEEMARREMPTTRTSKCLRACIMESLHLIQSGKFSVITSIKIARAATNDNPELVQLATEVTEECKDIVEPDRCELASKLSHCIYDGAVKRGADPRTFN